MEDCSWGGEVLTVVDNIGRSGRIQCSSGIHRLIHRLGHLMRRMMRTLTMMMMRVKSEENCSWDEVLRRVNDVGWLSYFRARFQICLLSHLLSHLMMASRTSRTNVEEQTVVESEERFEVRQSE